MTIHDRFEILPYRYYKTPTGRRVSIYSGFIPEGSELVTEGFTIFDHDHGVSGFGRPPYKTIEEAEAHKAWLLDRSEENAVKYSELRSDLSV